MITQNLRIWAVLFFLLCSIVAATYFVFIGVIRPAQEQTTIDEQRLRLANLAGRCESTRGEDGFGIFEVNRRIKVSDESGEITTPCRVSIKEGGSLTMEGVELQTKTFAIEDGGSNGKTTVDIRNSTLKGTEEAGVYINLLDPDDSISISGSTLEYPLGIYARSLGAQGEDDDGGNIEATQSSLTSLGPNTEGIQLMAGEDTGDATFVDLKLDTVQLTPGNGTQSKKILLLAGECRMERVEGYSGVCTLEDAAKLEQR